MQNHEGLKQGSQEWLAYRVEHDNASEIAAVLGLSKTTTRSELLQMKHTGLGKEFSDWVQHNVLDYGHEVEAKVRPLVEAMIGEDLYAVTCSKGRLSASLDGLNMSDEIAFECKQWNAQIADQVASGIMPEQHMPQCQQILLVTGAKKLIFAVGDGTPENLLTLDVFPDTVWFDQIIAGWAQFHIDLAAYVPIDIKEMPTAEVTVALPALFIHAKGEITTSNMKEYGIALTVKLKAIRAIVLVDDQDFSNAKEAAKQLRESIESARLAKAAMLSQTVTVGEAALMIDAWCEDMRKTALQLEKDVEREDKAKKVAMIARAKDLYETHIRALDAEIKPASLSLVAPAFAEAIKNKRSFASMQDAVDTELARAKIVSNESARHIRASLACLEDDGAGYEFLFHDSLALINKQPDDLKLLVKSRIAEHRAAEVAREEAQRQRIQVEEQAKAEKAAREKLAREQQEADAKRQLEERLATAQQGEDARQAAIAGVVLAVPGKEFTQSPTAIPIATPAANVVPMRAVAAPKHTVPPTVREQLNAHLDQLSDEQLQRVMSFVKSRYSAAA